MFKMVFEEEEKGVRYEDIWWKFILGRGKSRFKDFVVEMFLGI